MPRDQPQALLTTRAPPIIQPPQMPRYQPQVPPIREPHTVAPMATSSIFWSSQNIPQSYQQLPGVASAIQQPPPPPRRQDSSSDS